MIQVMCGIITEYLLSDVVLLTNINTGYSNRNIVNELNNWRTLFIIAIYKTVIETIIE